MRGNYEPSSNMMKRILHYILSKGHNGASLKETWTYFSENGDNFSPASIISQIERLKKQGLVVESRQRLAEGYQRRFYDPRFIDNDTLQVNTN